MILAVSVFSLILISTGSSEIGVKEGDWAKYRFEVEIPEEMTGIEGYEQFGQLEWVKIEVETVSGTYVTLKGTAHYTNGTEETETMPGTGFILDTDIGEGDEVSFPLFGPETPANITGSKQKTYAGASREVKYVEFDMEELGMSMDFEACWDKATGILCEMTMSIGSELIELDMSMSIKMIETNLWAGGLLSGQEPLILVAVIVIVVVAVAGSAILLMRRRKAPIPEVEPTPGEIEQT